MARSTAPSLTRPSRDTLRLIALAAGLDRSGSRSEDRYWENQFALTIPKLLRAGNDPALEAALETLSQDQPGAYEVLIEQAEALSESAVLDLDGQPHDVLLVVAPLAVWTRYTIPVTSLTASVCDILAAQWHGHVLAENVRLAIMPALVSVDQMPRTFSETWMWLQRLGAQALGGAAFTPVLNEEPDLASLLADTRYIVAAVAAPVGAPLFRWQEDHIDPPAARAVSLANWIEQAQPTLAALLPGCVVECLLPDAYYVSNRDADRRVRPLSLQAAIIWLQASLNLEPAQLRAVIAGCGEERIDEYRIGFTARNSNQVFYGSLWPLFGREDDDMLPEGSPDTVDEIVAQLKEYGVSDVRRIPGVLPAEFCDDCGAPHFPNPLGEMVHAELPDDAVTVPAHFH